MCDQYVYDRQKVWAYMLWFGVVVEVHNVRYAEDYPAAKHYHSIDCMRLVNKLGR